MNHYFEKLNIKANLKRNTSAILTSFLIGVFISSIPYIKNYFYNINYQRTVINEEELKIKEIEQLCKSEDSYYSRLIAHGFPQTAMEEFYSCINSLKKG